MIEPYKACRPNRIQLAYRIVPDSMARFRNRTATRCFRSPPSRPCRLVLDALPDAEKPERSIIKIRFFFFMVFLIYIEILIHDT